ncbi:MAG: carboxylating nicotinate-nucleotide diphosphorylase [Candidatus Omnitrophica bacterium]|nr:carboxylating nicotinate-nucleotide diphosphorylase [Candidatus Omnitrophota bacterium]MDD5310934.1 carboxylating nicotinate-nucleotide diphosphorylase [Candidatus Omnitrophota bacterium]MDD5545792.1 carboxylating nicotinate-nucleotide diphosphorylase [Candidatus Omnitrophota bacterium]
MIRRSLDEDAADRDITSAALFQKPKTAQAAIISGEEGVLCGITIAMAVFVMRNSGIKFMPLAMDGEPIRPEQQIAYIEGDAKAILSAERTALNFLSRLSGISTLTAEFVEAVRPYRTKIMDTRKTTPGLRILEKYAVKTGGGTNHRIGLHDQVLIKDNHLAAAGYNWDAVSRAVRSCQRKKIKAEIEVQDLKQFNEALKINPDIIMLDNMDLKEIKSAVALRDKYRHGLRLEVSGGVNLKNVKKIASTGVEMISIGALTHSVKAIDFSLEIVQ